MKKYALALALFVAMSSQATARIVDRYANAAATAVLNHTKTRDECKPAGKMDKTVVKGVEVYWVQLPSCQTYFTMTDVEGVGIVVIHSDTAADRKEAERQLLQSVELFNKARKMSR
ncbi:MAG TPA: hypothetical protein VGD46_18640 [Rhizobacter sp.]